MKITAFAGRRFLWRMNSSPSATGGAVPMRTLKNMEGHRLHTAREAKNDASANAASHAVAMASAMSHGAGMRVLPTAALTLTTSAATATLRFDGRAMGADRSTTGADSPGLLGHRQRVLPGGRRPLAVVGAALLLKESTKIGIVFGNGSMLPERAEMP